MDYSFNFANRGVVVTGGAQGIGLQISKDFLQSGAKVSIWDYSEEALKVARAELSQFASLLDTKKVDVTDMASCQAAANSLPFHFQVLINNAGITRDKSFAKMSAEEFESVVSTNLNGVFNVSKSLLEKFDPASKDKRIINIASIVAFNGNYGQTNYVAAKAGVIGMTKTLARELGKKGFTVNAIAPGFIRTAMTDKMPAEAVLAMSERVPVARAGEPKDISAAVLFLSSQAAQYINGGVLNIDGGLVI